MTTYSSQNRHILPLKIYLICFSGNRLIWPQTQNSEGCTGRNVPPSHDFDNRVPHSDPLPKLPLLLIFQEASEKLHFYKIILNIILYLCTWQYITPTSSTCPAFQFLLYSSVYLLSTSRVLFPALGPGEPRTDRTAETLHLGGLQTKRRA